MEKGTTFSFAGEGTLENPYQISNKEELAYLYYQVYNVNYFSYNKYWVVTKDIELNDETFYKDGTISGGDGVVYQWGGIGRYTTDLKKFFCGFFHGGNHTISGIYYTSSSDTSGKGLFGFTTGKTEIKNIKLKNTYISITRVSSGNSYCGALVGCLDYQYYGESLIENCEVFDCFVSGTGQGVGGLVGACASTANGKVVIKNCTVNADLEGNRYLAGILGRQNAYNVEITNTKYFGTINATKDAIGGFVGCVSSGTVSTKIKNSFVNGNISGGSYTGGFVGCINSATPYTEIKNSENYAKVKTTSIECAGFIARCYGNSLIENCINYGHITSADYGGGAMFGWSQGNKTATKIKNCKNYGRVSSPKGYCGVFAGIVEGFFDVDGFVNYGEVKAASTSALFGEMSTRYANESFIRINNVIQKAPYSAAILSIYSGAHASDGNKKVTIFLTNSEVHSSMKGSYYLLYTLNQKAEFFVKNLKIFDSSNTAKTFIGLCQGSSKAYFENVYIEANKSATSNQIYITKAAKAEVNCESVIFNNLDKKTYYGADFSGFYTDWKTGKIGLKALSGKGFFQGEVSEELLARKGFVKEKL